MQTRSCPFCTLQGREILAANDIAVAFFDGFPVSQGHALVVPRRHVASVFELTATEANDLWRLVTELRAELGSRFAPAGFNIGINDGTAAGQTVDHAHVHVIPRYEGDIADPRGGVRWVLASKADYWSNR